MCTSLSPATNTYHEMCADVCRILSKPGTTAYIEVEITGRTRVEHLISNVIDQYEQRIRFKVSVKWKDCIDKVSHVLRHV